MSALSVLPAGMLPAMNAPHPSDAPGPAPGPAPGVPPEPPPGEPDVCLRCGYALTGLDADGICPECGTPVADSRRGALLKFSDPEYVATLHRGVLLLLVGSITAIGLSTLGGVLLAAMALSQSAGTGGGGTWTGTLMQVAQGLQLLGVAGEAMVILGWWWFSTADPALPPAARGDRPRLVIRIALVFGVLGLLAGIGMNGTGVGPQTFGGGLTILGGVLMLLAGLAQVARFFGGMVYLRWMAPRLPDPFVGQRAKRYMWLLPLLIVIGSCILIGPLIATILTWLLLNRVRKHLKSIREGTPAPATA